MDMGCNTTQQKRLRIRAQPPKRDLYLLEHGVLSTELHVSVAGKSDTNAHSLQSSSQTL